MIGKIYCFTSPSDKSYVGKTQEESVVGDNNSARYHPDGREATGSFKRAIGKYGALDSDAWHLVIVQDGIVTQDELNRAERYWIALFRTMEPEFGYNLTEGGTGGRPNRETRKKLSEAAKIAQNRPDVKARNIATQKLVHNKPDVKERARLVAKEVTSRPEWKARQSAAQKAASARPEIRARRSAAQTGKKASDETRRRMSAAQKRPTTKAKRATTWSRPDVRARHSAALRVAGARPDVKMRRSLAQKEAQNRPEVKERISIAHRGKPHRCSLCHEFGHNKRTCLQNT